MSVYTENGHWRARFQINGKRHFVNLPHCKTKTEARHAEAEAKAKALRGELDTPAEKTTVTEFITSEFLPWSESNHSPRWHKEVKYLLPALKTFFGAHSFADLSPLLVEKFKSERRKTPTKDGQARKAATINRELAVLSSIFKLACKAGLLASNPAAQVSGLIENNERERVLEPEEEERLFTVLRARHNIVDSHLLPLVTLALHTGLRKSELLNLRVEEVDLTAGEIRRATSKNKRKRRVRLNAVARAALQEQLSGLGKDANFIFTNPDTGKPFTDVKKGWAAVLRAAGITGLCWHDLRATCATRMMLAGVPQATVAKVLGHRHTDVTDRYTRAGEQQQQAAVTVLEDWRKRA